jgi:amino acid adenylation domain-containing protein
MSLQPRNTDIIHSGKKCIHELFERQVETCPDAIAVVFEDQRLTYRELNRRANRLAHYLRKLGVGPEVLVGICVERSLEMIIGLLGILKAGGAYLPLDPTYPRPRLSFMLADGEVRIVLAQEHSLHKLIAHNVEVIALDGDYDAIPRASEENPDNKCTPANLAYVMYTSGSTGMPKGVSVPHRGVVRLVKETNYADFGPEQVFLQFAPLSFDASTFEIWGSLLNGSRLVLMPAGKASLAELGETVKRYNVTTIWLTAGLFHQMVESEFESLRGLRQLLAGGDVLSAPHVEQVARELSECQLINGYGPTENTTFTCCYLVSMGEGFESSVPIGRPVANTTVHILNDRLEPVPVGVAGELYIGGYGLARGYLNDVTLTAEKFVPNPFQTTGERLYRTGDSVRYLADGNIEFLGRIDQQVKVRGYRIELGEIETVLAQHPAVKECVVLARADQPGGRRLVAYLVHDSGANAKKREASHVSQWRTLYDDTYQTAAKAAPEFNIAGWNSSYNGQPIPPDEMREWVDHTVARILALEPRRVLEIGCGTGLLLLRIAPHCESYHGTDFSRRVIDQLEVSLKQSANLNHVTVSHREASDFSGLEPDSVDLVILNSVVQYFPSVDYLLKVLEDAVRVTRPGGAIFIGDLRNLDLLTAFHASVHLYKASPSLSVTELAARVRRAVVDEDELVIDPAFFPVVSRRLEKPCVAHVMPKRGHYQNELTKFRYDVVLEVASAPGSEMQVQWFDGRDANDVRGLLKKIESGEAGAGFGLSDVPNARVLPDSRLVDALSDAASGQTIGELRAVLRAQPSEGVDPEELWAWASVNCYTAHFSLANSEPDGRYDVVFSRRDGSAAAPHRWTLTRQRNSAADSKSWNEYVNRRSLKTSFVAMVAELRDFLRAKLPEYMMPSAFIFLDKLPLTVNGKVDRDALPAPEQSRPNLEQEFVAPRDQTEHELAKIWAEVLGIDRVGVLDSFFELGGHSLLASQVCARVRELLKADISLQAFFAAPTISRLALRIARDVQRQSMAGAITRQTDNTTAPLSFGQQRLWFMNQLVPGTPVHNIPAAIPLNLRPDVSVLERTLNEIVRRHAALRTTINIVNGQPAQLIAPSLELTLPVIDLTHLSAVDSRREAERLKSEEAHAPFDLEKGPLFRSKLVRLSEHRHMLLLTMHHIISDGWSMGVLLRELGILYQALAAGRQSPLPELPFQYADFTIWQRAGSKGGLLKQQLSYWQQQLEGASTTLQLPTDRPRPPRQSFRGARLSLHLPERLSRQINEFSQREEVTLFMTLLAAFNVLLHRCAGQEDINVGSPIVNRPHSDTEGLIGFFLNTLVLRTKFSRGANFSELLQQVRESALGAYANQEVPFEMLVEALNPERDLSRTPLFQVFFNLLNFADQRIKLPGLTEEYVSPVGVWSQPDESWSQFDMTLYASQVNEELRLILVYNSDLFDRQRMAVMLDQFRDLLEQVVTDPDKPIDAYSLLTRESRSLLPDPALPLNQPYLQPIGEVFFKRASELPDQPAICKGRESWSYRELAAECRAIAAGLLHDGLKPGEVVAVSGPPSFGLIAGMLGVLASGGVLLTLDRNLPSERLRLMIREAGARRLIYVGANTEAEADEGFVRETPSLVITKIAESGCALKGAEKFTTTKEELPQLNPDDPAYLFFTSGTTGVPKGVLGCHKGLSHFLEWQREEFKVTSADRAAQLTGLSFDVVLRDIFLPLTSGASLHLPDNPNDVTSGRILSWLERERITLLHTVPSVAQAWLNDLPPGVTLSALRWAFFAGEPLTDSLVRRWRESFSATGKLVNLYGPTETTLAKCFYVVPDEPSFGVQPVGQSLPETQALVLNRNRAQCGIGEAGEIVIRTQFRTLGYINAAEEQQARFIRNPFNDDANDLLYRTGDRGRFRPDGGLEILGRLDDQVKIRGLRVEPAEVTAILARHPSVQSCIVSPSRDAHGENALVAYVVMTAGDHGISELRTYLGKQLPAAMVPSWFVALNELPLTPNGKVDRRALPEPDRSLPELEQEFVGPRNSTEEIVAGIWSDVLGIDRISVVRDFFELGGHSLLATQIISRVRDAFQTELPLSSIFESPTVAGLSQSLLEAQKQSLEVSVPAIRALPRKRRRTTVY